MSAPELAAAPQKSTPVTDYVRTLTDEEKELTFIELLRQGLRAGWMPSPQSLTEDEAVVAARQRILDMLSRVPAERLREGDAALADLSKTVDAMELLERFSREDRD